MNLFQVFKLVGHYSKSYKNKMISCFFLLLLEALFTSLSFASIIPFVNIIIKGDGENINFPFIGKYINELLVINPFLIILIIAILLFSKSVVTILRVALSIHIGVGLKAKWICQMLGSLTYTHIKQLSNTEEGHKFSNIYILPEKSSAFIVSSFGYISIIAQAISIIIVMFFVEWKILFIGIILIGISFFCLHKPYINLASVMGVKTIKIKQTVFSYIYDSIRNIRDIKIFNLHNIIIKQLNTILSNEKKFEFKKQFINVFPSYSIELIAAVLLLIIYFVLLGSSKDSINFLLPKIIFFSVSVQKLLNSSATIASLNFKVVTQFKNFELMDKILTESLDEYEINKKANKKIPTSKKSLILKNLSFFYNKKQKILNNVNITIPLKKMIFFIGNSGTGKSSLMDIICKLREPSNGKVLLDDIDINQFNLQKWRDRISYVSQEPTFFSGTILDNITLFNKDINLKLVRKTAELIDCDKFIMETPKQYETLLSSSASNLSGGQRRRIALIRSLLKEPDILILDESLSSVDEKFEIKIIKQLKKMKTLSVFFISHRLSSIDLADEVFLFKNKNIFKK